MKLLLSIRCRAWIWGVCRVRSGGFRTSSSTARPCPKTARHAPFSVPILRAWTSIMMPAIAPCASATPASTGRLLHRRQDHRHLLPADLSGAHAARENVTFYPTAAAAQEAGFRPCLRCRPETAPDLGAWRGTSNTVSRALALIELGALDEASVDELGRTPGRRRAPIAAPVSSASRGLAGRGRADAAGAARQAAHSRMRPADGRNRLRRRIRQRAAVQRDLSDAVRPPPGALRRPRDATSQPRGAGEIDCCCATSRPMTGPRCWRSCGAAPSRASSGCRRNMPGPSLDGRRGS